MHRPYPRPLDTVLDLIGNTPMVRLHSIPGPDDAEVYVKMELLSPGFSVKDRIGLGMIERAERAGLLKPGGTIIEPTAGNTGVGLALAGVQLGYRVILCVPEHFSVEKREIMKALGGEVILTPKADGMKAAIAKAEELAKEIEGAYVPQQFVNPFNTEAHYDTTGPEIFEQMDGRVDAWVAGAGTGGTFSGVAQYLRERLPEIACYIVEPQGSILKGGEAGPHEVEGIGASTFIPPVLDMSLANDVITVEDSPAFRIVARLAREEGILAGGSGGANVEAALRVARQLGPGKRVVTLIPDAAERYISKGIFSKWVAEA
ncbi:MAG TPA: cysteine synthase A [Thermoanaerobaculia bacterium]|nr:cysteine synthase A [Thermoanaerobaculia bacterium]